jgi:ZIP family zinc transporter
MGCIGVSIVTVFLPILPIALGFAAGAMLFAISHEIIPETHRRGHENWATGGFTVAQFSCPLLCVSGIIS